jgi:hypothetical protein
MPDRFTRAQGTLTLVNQFYQGVLAGMQQQAQDANDVWKEVLETKSYSVDRLVPDMASFWLNGVGVFMNALVTGTRPPT